MSIENEADIESISPDVNDKVDRVDDQRFTRILDNLIKESEEMRLTRMKQHRTRSFLSMNLTILSILAGVSAFGWFFLMEVQLLIAFLLLGLSLIPPIFLHFWVDGPLKKYKKEHKTVFMPKLAKALNGLTYHPNRGVSGKMIEKLAVIPAHDSYEAEDCFMGVYKGVKVIFSEARLYSKNRKGTPVFDGIFVLLETPDEVFEGHTIITANDKMVKSYAKTRWKTMNPVHVSVSNPDWDKFTIYSTKPDSAELLIGERLLKELAEASDVFDNAPLTAVLFGKNRVFMMIPYDKDMFEPSDLFVPVTTKTQALQCKKEIEQLLEIIDVFDLYQPLKT
tara:strand:+ start:2390 stop:3397 length:1008 start_codon:yes stop_codon:yes gene_type:complete